MKENMHSNIDDLKALCDEKGGELHQVLVLVGNRYLVVSVDSYSDCMNDTIYFIDSRYDVGFKDIDKWYLLSVN